MNHIEEIRRMDPEALAAFMCAIAHTENALCESCINELECDDSPAQTCFYGELPAGCLIGVRKYLEKEIEQVFHPD